MIPENLSSAVAEHYRLERVLGRGGMATVYEAWDERHGRRVAVKVVNPELAVSLAGERFLQEIRIVARLTHPNILTLHDSGAADGFLYYVMPYVDDTLRARLGRECILPPDVALEIVSEVAEALDYAHRNGVVHRDIKPENILISAGHAVVADFGVARAVSTAGGDRLTRTGHPVGTLGYMSPEQAAGRSDLDERTDVYSLACVFYEMLVGEPPGAWIRDEAGELGRFIDAPPDHRDRLDNLPGFVEANLVKAMRLLPQDRYRSAGELSAALTSAFAGGPRYSEEEAHQIVRRAAELDARPTRDSALSLGGIQQIAAEAGIPSQHVREAASELARSEPKISTGGYLGRTGKIELEGLVEGEVSESQYGAVLEEIRRSIGQAGHVHETFDDSFSWEFKPGFGEWTRRVQVTLRPRDGQTRIWIVEHPGAEDELKIASVAGGAVLAGAAFAAVFNIGGDLAIGAGVLLGGAAFTAQYTAFRLWYRRFLGKRSRVLSELGERIANLVTGSGKAVLPAPKDER